RQFTGKPGPTTLGGRSFCPHCATMIPLYRNVPILTYVLQRGKTACCARRIPPVYCLLEVACTLLAAGCIALWGFSGTALLALLAPVLALSIVVAVRSSKD